MAEVSKQLHVPEFGYKNIEILKGEGNSLGIGSYGAVYKARCDDLPCAAKILHPTLFQSNDPGARRLLQRFEQECSFMNRIRHPNIVLYLGVCRDPQSGLPALLMELLEENLTSFLERSQEPLPFHVQVNLCYDVALALSYLHSNNIIHRDLSSNNVLMVVAGHGKAKVTDFGMSKLITSSGILKRFSMVSLTYCPGTEVYMPPEAFRGSPEYTDKLDCFSFGSLVIQIITRLFPDLGERTRVVPFPDSPTGTTEVPILETERRQSHIKLIDSDHPLLSIAVSCISYKPEERPSTQEICGKIVAIRDSVQYAESRQKNNLMPQVTCRDRVEELNIKGKKLPRTISSANLETAGCCRSMVVVQKYYQQPDTNCTVVFPSLTTYPAEFEQMVWDHLIDKETQQVLEREHTLNWCKSSALLPLVPLRTRDDGNSLCHAASLAMWGLHDSELKLREGISSVMREEKSRFSSTFMYKHEVTSKAARTKLESQCDEEWKVLANIITTASDKDLENLREFHIFALACCLKRPIIVYANCNDTNLHNINYHGIYLPLGQDSRFCHKSPLPLAYQRGHFSALVCQHNNIFLPICDYYGRMFPVKYLLHNESSSSLLWKYLNIESMNIGQIPDKEPKSPYFNATHITCAVLKVEQLPENMTKLVNEFIDACYIEYVREQQP